jgi:hypothetical protein
MNLFGKKKNAAPAVAKVNPVDTIRLLRDSLETLEKREAHITKRVDLALTEAKQKAAKKDKRGEEISRSLDHGGTDDRLWKVLSEHLRSVIHFPSQVFIAPPPSPSVKSLSHIILLFSCSLSLFPKVRCLP